MTRKLLGAALCASLFALPAFAAAPDAQMQKVLDAHKSFNGKPFHQVEPKEARKGPTATDAVEKVLSDEGKPTTPEPLAKVEDRRIPGPSKQIDVRVYTPEGKGPFPAIVYWHGGGFVVADLDVYDAAPRALAKQVNAVVISAHYRQAPENKFPASHDDAVAAFNYVAKHPDEFNIDAKRIAVAGESAGANLATSVAMSQAKSKGPAPVFQLLVYPFVSNDMNTPSHASNGQGNYLVGTKDLEWFWKHELGANWKENKTARALPIHAKSSDLKGLPPALVIVAGLDPLLDEGIAYSEKLKAAGVQTELKQYDGVTHEFFGMAPVVDTAKRAQADAAAALKGAFEVGVGGSGR